MECKVRFVFPESLGFLPDGSPHGIQVCGKQLIFTWIGGSDWDKVTILLGHNIQICVLCVSLLFLTGWPAWITALGIWSKDTDWCVFSTTQLIAVTTQVRGSTAAAQTLLLLSSPLAGACCSGLSRGFFHSFGIVTSACHNVEVKLYIVFTEQEMLFIKNVLQEEQDCLYG